MSNFLLDFSLYWFWHPTSWMSPVFLILEKGGHRPQSSSNTWWIQRTLRNRLLSPVTKWHLWSLYHGNPNGRRRQMRSWCSGRKIRRQRLPQILQQQRQHTWGNLANDRDPTSMVGGGWELMDNGHGRW